MAQVVVPRSSAHWPLTVLLAGFPLWWALGLASLVPLLLAVPMGYDLLTRHPVRVPRGFGWWLLFLVWVSLGVAVLFADAPGAVTGGGAERLMVFGYRLGWYAACTVVLLWLGNADRREVPDRLVHGLLALLFGYAVAGGFLGLLAPDLEFRTPFEAMLPGGLRSNGFVASLVHAEVADVQQVLGRPESRPKAPFPFTNTWGSVLSLTLVFFVAVLAARRRVLLVPGALVLVAASVPVVYSLNRGLWAALGVGVLGLTVLALLKRRPVTGIALGAIVVIGAVAFLASPLGDLSSERLDNQHSNARRGQLLTETVSSVTDGSPVVGFGSTRDVQGNFASISGGATPDCPACGVPPLGTQGHLWLVLFSQGWPGLAFFLVFVVLALSRSVRCRTVNETVATFVTGFFLLQLAIYDTLGIPLYVVMIAIALVWREQRTATSRAGGTAEQLAAQVRRAAPLTAVLAVAGAGLGWGWAAHADEPTYESTVAMVITPAPLYLDTGVPPGDLRHGVEARAVPREITIDTEAALLLSEPSLTRTSEAVAVPVPVLRPAIEVTAEPNSRVLLATVRQGSGDRAEDVASAVADSYLVAREEYLKQRREHLLSQLHEQLRRLAPGDPSTFETRLRYLTAAIDHLRSTEPSVGYVFRVGAAHAVRSQHEVPAVSGLALGLLAGVALSGVRRSPGRIR